MLISAAAGLFQQLHHSGVASLAGVLQRSNAIGIGNVGISPRLQQQCHNLCMRRATLPQHYGFH